MLVEEEMTNRAVHKGMEENLRRRVRAKAPRNVVEYAARDLDKEMYFRHGMPESTLENLLKQYAYADDDPPAFRVGDDVAVAGTAEPGTITAAHADGTFDVKIDRDTKRNVPLSALEAPAFRRRRHVARHSQPQEEAPADAPGPADAGDADDGHAPRDARSQPRETAETWGASREMGAAGRAQSGRREDARRERRRRAPGRRARAGRRV